MNTRPSPATLNDVAQAAGVHISTASRALDPARRHLLSEATRDRVARAAESMGYQANAWARSLRTGTSGLVGIVAPDVANPFVGPFLRGVEDVMYASDRMLLIAETHDDSATLREVVRQMVTRRLDALLITAARRGDEPFLAEVAQTIPVVLAVRSLESGGLPTVVHDDRHGAALAAQHLVELGHVRLAQICGAESISSFRERSRGFAEYLSRSSARDVSVPEPATDPSVDEGRRLAGRLFDLPAEERPTAIFAHNDLLAVGALAALAERGLRCPDDVSVVGYNDSPLTDHLSPPLTTVRVPTAELGTRAGRLVDSLLGGALESELEPLPPSLVVRESTCAPADVQHPVTDPSDQITV